KIPVLLRAQHDDRGILHRALRAAVPTVAVIGSVTVVFAVRLVVLVVVAHEIAQREAVVGSDEVEARARPPAIVRVEIAAARESRSHFAHGATAAFPKAAHTVAVFTVPL